MSLDSRIRATIVGALLLALGATAFVFLRYPPPFTAQSVTAFGTLMALSLLSMMLFLRFTEGGSTTSMDFVPELGAILLLGPAGAVSVTLVSELLSEFLLYRSKPLQKKLFNLAQVTLAVAAAGLAFVAFQGLPSLNTVSIAESFPPFFIAVLAYFTVNSGTVAYIVSLAEKRPFFEAWRHMTGGLIIFDIAMSPLAFLVAYFYVRWGPFAVLFAIIPLIGLRYSYGINFELRQLNSDLLRLMVKTIEAQDPYTSGHSIRVAESARLIAQRIPLSNKQVQAIETAALLHDIGKIDVAYSEILRQKGPLTDTQKELIRAHPERGVEIIRSIRSIREDVLECVRHHHERWDGDGYPSGLEGESIPIGARIIMVCDTIDAMTTARPYRDALPVTVVREELKKHSGAQFDPQIVSIVLEGGLIDQIASLPSSPSISGPRIRVETVASSTAS